MNADDNISMQKSALRAEARERRKTFIAAGVQLGWTVPAHHLGREFGRGVAIASYRPTGSEADPSPIEELARNARMVIGYPGIDGDGAMRFYAPGPSHAFVRNRLGFDAPAGDAAPMTPAIVLVPLLAFDRRGTRLGQGGGHYDRALADFPRALKIGVAWSVQEVADLPREAWDVPLDIVITEREWIVSS